MEKFVVYAAWAAQSETAQAEVAFGEGEEQFHLLPELHRDVILAGLGDGVDTGLRLFPLLGFIS